jgi:amino-acid N-acetyltransferase
MSRPRVTARVVLRGATAAYAPVLHTLIDAHREEGHLLARDRGELAVHAPRFVVAIRRGRIIGCGELAPLGGRVAEVRSLVVGRAARGFGVGRAIVTELQRRARTAGVDQLCAFTHDVAYFVRLGFSLVPHTWVPEKIARDCTECALFRRCGQQALVRPLADSRSTRARTFVPLAALRG